MTAILAPQIGAAAELAIGVGGSYTQVGWDATAGKSNYAGAGALGDLRLGLPFKGSRAGVEFFGSYSDQFLENTNHSLGETNRQSAIGGGADFYFGPVFLGGQYELVTTKISGTNLSADLNYDEYGPRAGVHIRLKGRFSIMLGALADFGSLDVPANGINQNRDVTEYRAFLFFRFKLLGSSGRSSESYSAK